jgi:hypothetical protein
MKTTINHKGHAIISTEGQYFAGFQFDPTKISSPRFPTWSKDPLDTMVMASLRDAFNFLNAHQTDPASLRVVPIERVTTITIDDEFIAPQSPASPEK